MEIILWLLKVRTERPRAGRVSVEMVSSRNCKYPMHSFGWSIEVLFKSESFKYYVMDEQNTNPFWIINTLENTVLDKMSQGDLILKLQ